MVWPSRELLEDGLRPDEPENVIEPAVADGQDVVRLVAQLLPGDLGPVLEIEVHHLGPRRQHRADVAVVEVQDVADHLVLGVEEHALFGPLLEHHPDLLGGHPGLLRLPDAEEAKDAVGRETQHPHDGTAGGGEQLHRARDERGDGLRMRQRKALGHELADDQRKVGEEEDHDAERQSLCIGSDGRNALEAAPDPGGDRSVADGTVQDADAGDADLDARQETRRLRRQDQRVARAGVARVGHLHEPRALRTNDRDLRHREDAIEEYQHQQEQNVTEHGFLILVRCCHLARVHLH